MNNSSFAKKVALLCVLAAGLTFVVLGTLFNSADDGEAPSASEPVSSRSADATAEPTPLPPAATSVVSTEDGNAPTSAESDSESSQSLNTDAPSTPASTGVPGLVALQTESGDAYVVSPSTGRESVQRLWNVTRNGAAAEIHAAGSFALVIAANGEAWVSDFRAVEPVTRRVWNIEKRDGVRAISGSVDASGLFVVQTDDGSGFMGDMAGELTFKALWQRDANDASVNSISAEGGAPSLVDSAGNGWVFDSTDQSRRKVWDAATREQSAMELTVTAGRSIVRSADGSVWSVNPEKPSERLTIWNATRRGSAIANLISTPDTLVMWASNGDVWSGRNLAESPEVARLWNAAQRESTPTAVSADGSTVAISSAGETFVFSTMGENPGKVWSAGGTRGPAQEAAVTSGWLVVLDDAGQAWAKPASRSNDERSLLWNSVRSGALVSLTS